jgi:LysR family transcriptional activator of nhaA
MEWLNYHHLLYFWTVARVGTIARASEELRLAQPTISGQIRALEDQLGEKLFQRSGRNLAWCIATPTTSSPPAAS